MGCRVELQPGVSEESIDQLRLVLDPLEPVLHHRNQLISLFDTTSVSSTTGDAIAQARFRRRSA